MREGKLQKKLDTTDFKFRLIFDSKPPDIGQKALEKRENMWGWCRLEKQCSGIIWRIRLDRRYVNGNM